MLPNPERAWSATTTPRTIDRAEIERRIGPTSEALEILTGGLANINVRIGRDRVLRIQRDPTTLAKHATLLRHPWQTFRTPTLLQTGPDFLLLEHLELRPLPATAASGEAVGRALAEIHAHTYQSVGDLDATLSLIDPTAADTEFAARGYGHANLVDALPVLPPSLASRISSFLDTNPIASRDALALDTPVLCHCDFKVSNLHTTPTNDLVILDWDSAWAGPRLLDIGLLLRWPPPASFTQSFATSYRASGGTLIDDWRRIAEAIDLGSLLSVYGRNAIARSTPDVERRLIEIVAG